MASLMTLKQPSDIKFVDGDKEGIFDREPIETIGNNIEKKDHNMNKDTVRR